MGGAQFFQLVRQAHLRAGDRHVPDRAVLVEQVDHTQVGQSGHRQPGDLAHRRGQLQGAGQHRSRLDQQVRRDIAARIDGGLDWLPLRLLWHGLYPALPRISTPTIQKPGIFQYGSSVGPRRWAAALGGGVRLRTGACRGREDSQTATGPIGKETAQWPRCHCAARSDSAVSVCPSRRRTTSGRTSGVHHRRRERLR